MGVGSGGVTYMFLFRETTQWAFCTKMTSYQRRCDVISRSIARWETSCSNIVLITVYLCQGVPFIRKTTIHIIYK